MSREYWDDGTDALYVDICDELAQRLQKAFDEETHYVKFNGEIQVTRNPGWLNAALVLVDMLENANDQVPDNMPENLKKILKDLKDKVDSILKATNKVIAEEGTDTDNAMILIDLSHLYSDLLTKIDGLIYDFSRYSGK